MTQLDRALVNTINAQNAAVAGRIDAVYMSAAPTPEEKVLDFDAVLAVADAVVGRDAVFAALETFRTNHDRGYFDVVAEAGLGKTALAAAITRRYDAICFFTSATRGLKRAEQFLTHASAALIVKYKENYARLPENIGSDGAFFTKVLREAAATVAPGRRAVDRGRRAGRGRPSSRRGKPAVPTRRVAEIGVRRDHPPTRAGPLDRCQHARRPVPHPSRRRRPGSVHRCLPPGSGEAAGPGARSGEAIRSAWRSSSRD